MARILRGGGKGGRMFNDRELSGEVRMMALTQIRKALTGKSKKKEDVEFRKAILLRLSSSLLPRLNELSGPDGEPLGIHFDSAFNAKP